MLPLGDPNVAGRVWVRLDLLGMEYSGFSARHGMARHGMVLFGLVFWFLEL